MKAIKLFLLLLFIPTLNVLSQDIIRTKSDTIRAKVIEIGIEEIKYRDFSNPEGPVIVISKADVREIIYENGARFTLKPDEYDVNKEIEVRSKKHAIKFELFSPVHRDIVFGFEKSLKVGTNLEFKLGIIGPGFNKDDRDASGVFLKAGVKFLTSPQYTTRGLKYVHALKGKYIKPELIFNSYREEYFYYTGYYPNPVYQSAKVRQSNLGLSINFGNQHILGNVITLDYYIGVGYGVRIEEKDFPEDYYFNEYAYSHLYLGNDTPLLLTGGFTMGVLY